MKELKHIKTIETIDKVLDLKAKKLDTVKELKDTIQYEKSKYSIQVDKSATFGGKFHLIDKEKPSYPVLYGALPGKIKSYLNIRNVDIDLVHGKELIYKELPESDEYKAYDDLIDNIEKSITLYKELRQSVNYEYCDYRLGKYKEGLYTDRYRLSTKEDPRKYLVDGSKARVNSYIDKMKIDRDQIFNIELMDEDKVKIKTTNEPKHDQ